MDKYLKKNLFRNLQKLYILADIYMDIQRSIIIIKQEVLTSSILIINDSNFIGQLTFCTTSIKKFYFITVITPNQRKKNCQKKKINK